jgi:hypothetical protein
LLDSKESNADPYCNLWATIKQFLQACEGCGQLHHVVCVGVGCGLI